MDRADIYQAVLSAVIAVVLFCALLVVLAFSGCAGTGVGVRVSSPYGHVSYDLPDLPEPSGK